MGSLTGIAGGGARLYVVSMLTIVAVCLAVGISIGGGVTGEDTTLDEGRDTLSSMNANVTADMQDAPPGYREFVGPQIDMAMASMRAGFEYGYRHPGVAGPLSNALAAGTLLANGWYCYRRIRRGR